MLAASKQGPLHFQLFAPVELIDNPAWGSDTFSKAEGRLAISWNSTTGSKVVAEWALSNEDGNPRLSFHWQRSTEEAKKRLRLCAIVISGPGTTAVMPPKPLKTPIGLLPNLQWKQARYIEHGMAEDMKVLADLGLKFMMREAVLDTNPKIHFTSSSQTGLATETPPLTSCRVTSQLNDGKLRLGLETTPSEKEFEEIKKKLEYAWASTKFDEKYAAAVSLPNSQIDLEKAGLNVLEGKLTQLEMLLNTAEKIDKQKKVEAATAIAAIRKDFVEPYRAATAGIEKMSGLLLDTAKLKRLSFGYEIPIEGLSDPVFVELVQLGDGGTKTP